MSTPNALDRDAFVAAVAAALGPLGPGAEDTDPFAADELDSIIVVELVLIIEELAGAVGGDELPDLRTAADAHRHYLALRRAAP